MPVVFFVRLLLMMKMNIRQFSNYFIREKLEQRAG